MNNKKLLLLSASATAMLLAPPTNATMHVITYDFAQDSQYTSTMPLDPSGQPDPTNFLTAPAFGSTHGIASVPVVGTGLLNTETGEIHLAPIDFETNVTSGSTGVVGWSQTFNGSFSDTTYTQSGSATVNDGVLVCEDALTAACDGAGGVGAAPVAMEIPQLFEIVQTGCNPLGFGCTDTPVTTVLGTIEFNSLTEGGQGQYLFEGSTEPDFTITTINMTIGKVVQAPVPAAIWLFGSSLLGLFVSNRVRRKTS